MTKRRRGLSLIEVVLTIVILGLAVPPLTSQLASAVKQQETFLVQQNLNRLASERMWEVFADHTNPTRGFAYIVDTAYPAETDPDSLSGYTRATTILEVDPADYVTPQPGSGVKRFRIVVTGPADQTLAVESFVTSIPGAASPPED